MSLLRGRSVLNLLTVFNYFMAKYQKVMFSAALTNAVMVSNYLFRQKLLLHFMFTQDIYPWIRQVTLLSAYKTIYPTLFCNQQ